MIGNPPPQLLEVALDAAIIAGRMSPCAKSKRGAAVFNPRATYAPTAVLGVGFNGQPPPWRCNRACGDACRLLCIHAEARALRAAMTTVAGYSGGQVVDLDGLDLVHIKIDERGRPVASGPPSCELCSPLVVDYRIAGVWLLEEGKISDFPEEAARDRIGLFGGLPPRWTRYPGEEFHQRTLEARKLVRVAPTMRPA